MKQRSDKKLDGLPLQFFDLYVDSRKQPAKNILTVRADLGRDRIAAMMFLIHGEAATYQVGWTSDKGRDMHAHNLILWKGIEELRSRGIMHSGVKNYWKNNRIINSIEELPAAMFGVMEELLTKR